MIIRALSRTRAYSHVPDRSEHIKQHCMSALYALVSATCCAVQWCTDDHSEPFSENQREISSKYSGVLIAALQCIE